MITKVTSENTTKYKALFEKVNEILGLPKKDDQGTVITQAISTLDGYFQHLHEISLKDPSLIILPLDEEKFFIDGNSRKITVPQAFTKNGVGVQGDHYAEYIYFEIDRYFENIDFGSPSITAVVEFIDANQQKHFTKAWIKYTDEESSKIIIGWPITQDVTSKAGTIKFSVRLFELNTDGNSYKRSFGTLIGQLVVNPSLDLAISKAEIDNIQGDLNDDVENEVLSRMIDSPAADYSSDKVVSPVFLFRYKEGVGPNDPCSADAGDVLNVQAIAPGSVVYSWYKEKDEKTTNLQAKPVFKKLDTFKEDIPIYEIKIINGSSQYRLADVSRETFAEGGPYYEKYSEYILPKSEDGEVMNDITGTYYCVAQNNMYGFSRASNQDIKVPEGERWTADDCKIGVVTVPGPTPFGELTKLPDKIEIRPGASFTVSAAGATEKDRDVYSWSFTGDDGKSENIAIKENSCNLLDAEGTYKVFVTRTRNGKTSDSQELGSCHAYKKPQAVEFIEIDGKAIDSSQGQKTYSIPKTATVCEIKVKANGKFEDYKVQWYKEAGENDVPITTNFNTEISKPDGNGVFTISFNPSTIDNSSYYPKVVISKTNVEGIESKTCSFEDIGYLSIVPVGTSG